MRKILALAWACWQVLKRSLPLLFLVVLVVGCGDTIPVVSPTPPVAPALPWGVWVKHDQADLVTLVVLNNGAGRIQGQAAIRTCVGTFFEAMSGITEADSLILENPHLSLNAVFTAHELDVNVPSTGVISGHYRKASPEEAQAEVAAFQRSCAPASEAGTP